MAHPTSQYITSEYLENNPTWDLEDTPWKAGLVADILDKNLIKPRSICEVGCGSGGCLAELRQIYPEADLSGFDIAPDAASFWKQYDGMNIHFEVGDILKITTLKNDVLLTLDVIEHVPDPHSFLNGLHGKAEFYVFHIPLDLSAASVFRETPLLYVRNKVGHVHYFTKQLALALLKESGYQIVDVNYTQAAFTAPVRSWKTILARPIRKLLQVLLSKDRSVRLLGGETLIVLARQK